MKTIIVDGWKFTKTGGKKYHYNSTLRRHLHQYIWERVNGPIPKGYEIHHIDINPENNDIENLQLIKTEDHRKLHGEISWNEERKEWARNNLLENAIPKASEWHKSEAGSDWHKQHYENMKHKFHRKIMRTCDNCGIEYEGEDSSKARFCSNKCKSRFRRASGVDDVVIICKVCGKEKLVDKYRKQITCSRSCSNRLRGKLKDSPNLQE